MIATIILALLCLALASVIVRALLFLLGKEDTRLARITSVTKSIGFIPLVAFGWACNLAIFGLLLLMLGYWVAPESVMDLLGAK